MKYKVLIKTIEIIDAEADNEAAALEQVKNKLNPRILGEPITFEIFEVPEEVAQ